MWLLHCLKIRWRNFGSTWSFHCLSFSNFDRSLNSLTILTAESSSTNSHTYSSNAHLSRHLKEKLLFSTRHWNLQVYKRITNRLTIIHFSKAANTANLWRCRSRRWIAMGIGRNISCRLDYVLLLYLERGQMDGKSNHCSFILLFHLTTLLIIV